MKLLSIAARGFRNLGDIRVEPGPHATVFFGENGQGKTNLIEAAYFLLGFRSFRTRAADELVQWNQPASRLEASIDVDGLVRVLTAELAQGKKTFRLDGKPVRRDSAALAHVGTVLFVPEDLLLPKASPAERRRFLDLAIFGTDRGYYRHAQIFQKVLRGRNAILRRAGPVPGPGSPQLFLETFDEQLASAGAILIDERRKITLALAPRVQDLFSRIHAPLEVTLGYSGHDSLRDVHGREQLRVALLDGLRARHDLDWKRGHTGFGPHTDDLELRLAGRPAREHGSQGQLRSLVLALKLAELENQRAILGEPPLLLLDDVASELDETRRQRLFETIANLDGQTLVTVTDRGFLPQLPGRVDFRVSTGQVSRA